MVREQRLKNELLHLLPPFLMERELIKKGTDSFYIDTVPTIPMNDYFQITRKNQNLKDCSKVLTSDIKKV